MKVTGADGRTHLAGPSLSANLHLMNRRSSMGSMQYPVPRYTQTMSFDRYRATSLPVEDLQQDITSDSTGAQVMFIVYAPPSVLS